MAIPGNKKKVVANKNGEKRCTNCGKLLFRGTIKDGTVEVKCQCGTMNVFEVRPDGQSFQDRIYLNRKYRLAHENGSRGV